MFYWFLCFLYFHLALFYLTNCSTLTYTFLLFPFVVKILSNICILIPINLFQSVSKKLF